MSETPSPPPDSVLQTPAEHADELFAAIAAYYAQPGKISSKSPLFVYHKAARWIFFSINLFCNVRNALHSGVNKENATIYTIEDHNDFKKVVKLIPFFADTLAEFHKKPERLATLINLMSKWADGSRNEDTAVLKKNVIAYIPLDPHTETVHPPIPETDKSLRGLNHIMTARLLCPQHSLHKFDHDTSAYIQWVMDGEEQWTHNDLPSFLYGPDPLYSRKEFDRGLLRGHSARCILTGPSSAISKVRKAAKSSKAEIHNLTSITPEAIAYIAVLTRQTLTSTEHWSTIDGVFAYQEFYTFIVELFQDEDDPWVKDTLAFWNSEIPGLQRKGHKRSADATFDEGHEVLLDEILALRRQRRLEQNRNQFCNQDPPTDSSSPESNHTESSETPPTSSPSNNTPTDATSSTPTTSNPLPPPSSIALTMPTAPGAPANPTRPPSSESAQPEAPSADEESDEPPVTSRGRGRGNGRGKRGRGTATRGVASTPRARRNTRAT